MAREKEAYRDNLERILEAFPGREILYQKEIAQWLHMDSRTVKANFPMKGGGARGASCWISVASLARAIKLYYHTLPGNASPTLLSGRG